MKLKVLHVKDKSAFEEGSVEWKRVHYQEQMALLPPQDSPDVSKNYI